jgi:hypothetical protein
MHCGDHAYGKAVFALFPFGNEAVSTVAVRFSAHSAPLIRAFACTQDCAPHISRVRGGIQLAARIITGLPGCFLVLPVRGGVWGGFVSVSTARGARRKTKNQPKTDARPKHDRPRADSPAALEPFSEDMCVQYHRLRARGVLP